MDSQPTEDIAILSKSGRGNKRARLVCLRCHEKKIKCDLQSNTDGGASPKCTKCELVGYECRVRPSKRGAGNQSSNRHNGVLKTESPSMPPLLPLPYDPTNPSSNGSLVSNQSVVNGKQNPIAGSSPNQNSAGLSSEITRISYPRHDSTARQQRTSFTAGQGLGSPQQQQQQQQLNDTRQQQLGSGHRASGYLGGFTENRLIRSDTQSALPLQLNHLPADIPPPALQEGFKDTYFEYVYTWCPVLERNTSHGEPCEYDSILLKQALALLGSRIEPPVMHHATPAIYYERAKASFYGSREKDPLTCLRALLLLIWWSSPPSTVSTDSDYWWTGVAIRLGQQIGLHREPQSHHGVEQMKHYETQGLRRRIWWTLFARERLFSICHGQPCIIDPSDCNIAEPTLEDFSELKDIGRAQIFIHWVQLCGTVGRVAKYLSRKTESTPFPTHLARELIDWVQCLPENQRLPIATNCTIPFNRDVHQLHLPYLTTITLLYLTKSPQSLPRAYTAAMLSASCVARIFEDYLARGSIRFLPGIANWYIAVAILTLLHGRQVQCLTESADNHINILRIALKELSKMWHLASIFDQAFDQLLANGEFAVSKGRPTSHAGEGGSLSELADLATGTLINWMDFFPFASTKTSPLVAILLRQDPATTFSDVEWPDDLSLQLRDIYGSFASTDGIIGAVG
ncbi:hypothetical protein AJ80_00544 [Polytolypa hystricis UAMH7299]|uniref:Zn(2)-C6 fungal-type domain-containing protein n=1 Tax=Polytolypa hystricis (strain UAMH7299) TaxID=1447883 RepID=A0A2B7Z1E8_POLH7|nr:hypothetical protein AJ80_00544 [Polytolypa hystricis UAMH7299]